MSTTEPLDTARLSRLIELRLKEMNRPDQAAAFVRLGFLRMMLDRLSTTVEHTGGTYTYKIFAPNPRFAAIRPVEKSAFLTPIDSDHNALVLDFDSMVTKLGELSLVLLNRVADARQNRECASDKRCITIWELEDPDELFAAPQRVPLQGSLAGLKPVGELSHAYSNPDFSKNRLRPTNFLRSS